MTISSLRSVILSGSEPNFRSAELINTAKSLKNGEIALASELCFNGYKAFDDTAILNQIQSNLPHNAYFGFTRLNDKFNQFTLISNQGIIYTQNKSYAFKPSKEDEKFIIGDENLIKLFELNGVKIGVLICFEIRFIHLWKQLQGADLILVPAMWGKARKEHFITLCKALALQNRCFVVSCSDIDLKFGTIFAPDGTDLGAKSNFNPNKILEFKQSIGL